MNFTPELSAFQGAILSADNVHQFSKLTARGGNEDDINTVIKCLSKFLKNNNYISNGTILNSSVSDFRKLALFLVLNADLPELQHLVELDDLSMVIWTTPTIPKCLLCELMWKLHMEKFVVEIISFATPQLALEVAGAFLGNFKYFNPLECLNQLKLLAIACYTLLTRLHLLNSDATELENKTKAALHYFIQCVRYYTTPPNYQKLNALGKDEMYKYQGDSLYSLLQVIDECLNLFTNQIDVNPAGFSIYKLTFADESLKKDHPIFNINESANSMILECLNKGNTTLLDTCKMLVMDVSVDIFCCWSEIEKNDKNMQLTVGELCYKVRNQLLQIDSLAEHPLTSMIEHISCKPIEMLDKINGTGDAVVIQNIALNNDDSKVWIKALIYKETLNQNMELLNIVDSNLDKYNEDESYTLYLTLRRHMGTVSDNDFLEALSLKVFQKCELSKKIAILERRFSDRVFVDMKKTQEYKSALITIFNKLIATPEADFTDVLTVFIQNPMEVLTKIFQLAAENAQQTKLMLKIIKLLESFSNHYYSTETEPCIIQITQILFEELDTEAKQNNFIKFISELKTENIIPPTKLFLLIIMTNLHKALLNKDISKLNLQMKLLNEAYGFVELIEYRAPLLAMLAQVMEVVRWKLNTFTILSPVTLNMAIDLQISLMDSYVDGIPENQCEWLKSKIRNLDPLNMYYYRELWEPPGSSYMEIVSGLTIHEDTRMNELTSWLSQVICSCTQEEWCDIWDSLRMFENVMILNIMHVAVAMITLAEKANRTENSWSCMLYCYRNFMYVTRYKFLAHSITDAHVQSILNKAAMIAELVREENIEEFGTVLMPLFAYLTEKQDQYEVNFVECINENLGHTKLSPLVRKVFINGSA